MFFQSAVLFNLFFSSCHARIFVVADSLNYGNGPVLIFCLFHDFLFPRLFINVLPNRENEPPTFSYLPFSRRHATCPGQLRLIWMLLGFLLPRRSFPGPKRWPSHVSRFYPPPFPTIVYRWRIWRFEFLRTFSLFRCRTLATFNKAHLVNAPNYSGISDSPYTRCFFKIRRVTLLTRFRKSKNYRVALQGNWRPPLFRNGERGMYNISSTPEVIWRKSWGQTRDLVTLKVSYRSQWKWFGREKKRILFLESSPFFPSQCLAL